MSLRLYLFGMGGTALTALAVWIWMLLTVNPFAATRFEWAVFYGSTLLWLVGLFSLGGFYVRLLKSRNEYYYGNLITSFRQGGLAGVYLVTLLLFQSWRILGIAEVLMLLLAIILFELYFLAKQS